MEPEPAGRPVSRERLTSRITHVHALDEVARRIGKNRDLIEIVSASSDNIDDGGMIWVDNGTGEGIRTFTDHGIECVQELIADSRTREGGIRGFLRHRQCEPDVIERVMADESRR